MGIGVAGFPEGHPETPNRLQEIEYLKRKVMKVLIIFAHSSFLTTEISTISVNAVNWPA